MSQKLHSLLCDLFNGDEADLRLFLKYGIDGKVIEQALPGNGAPLKVLVDSAVSQLVRRGLVPDTLKRLRLDFPNRKPAIDHVAESLTSEDAPRDRHLALSRAKGISPSNYKLTIPLFMGIVLLTVLISDAVQIPQSTIAATQPRGESLEGATSENPKKQDATKKSSPLALPMPRGRCPDGMVFIRGTEGHEFYRNRQQMDIDNFCMDETEVTVAEFRDSAEPESLYKSKSQRQDNIGARYDQWCNTRHTDRDAHPVNCVDLKQATAHCESRGKRLPTVWEWEWAAQGRDDARSFPWGPEEPTSRRLNACGKECLLEAERLGSNNWGSMYAEDDGYSTTAPVGSKPEGDSRDGLKDMAGNVMEWTYSHDPQDNEILLHGGGWACKSRSHAMVSDCGAMHLDLASQTEGRSAEVGFRCARSLHGS